MSPLFERDPRLPIDPNSPEAYTSTPSGGIVDPVQSVGAVGRRSFGQRGRGILDKIGQGNYSFPDEPAVLPYRPNVGTALLAGAKGFLKGLSPGQETKLKREELAQRKEESAARIEQAKAETDLRKEEAAGRKEDRTFNRQKATFDMAKDLNIPYSLAGKLVDGSMKGDDEINSYMDEAAKLGMLDPRSKQLYALKVSQIKGTPGSPEYRDARFQALKETADIGMKIAKGEQDSVDMTREMAAIQLRNAKRDEKLGGFSPAQIEAQASDWEKTGIELQNSISSRMTQLGAALARGGAQDFVSQLFSPDQGAQVDVLNQAKMSANPEIKKLATDILKDISTVQELYDRAKQYRMKLPGGGDIKGLTAPSYNETVDEGQGGERKTPAPALDLFASPDDFKKQLIPDKGTRGNYPEGTSPSQFVREGGVIPSGPGGVKDLTKLIINGDNNAMAQYASDFELINPENGEPLMVPGPDGKTLHPPTYAEKFRVIQAMLKKYGPEKTQNYLQNVSLLPPTE